MSVKEPKFNWGGDLIKWRMDYVEKWLSEKHPSLICCFRKTNCGGYDVWIALNKKLNDDSIFMNIQCPEYMIDSRTVIGKATVMKGLHVFTAQVMCERIEKCIKKTGNYDQLMFLDAIAKRIKFDTIEV